MQLQVKIIIIINQLIIYTESIIYNQTLNSFHCSAGNLQTYPIFSLGAPASLCKTGKNPKYPGLCSEKEDMAQHKNGNLYFKNEASELSPVVKEWLQNCKKIEL